MSSVGSSFAQKSGRTTFFLGLRYIAAVSGSPSSSPAFTVSATTPIPTSTVSRAHLDDQTATGFGATASDVSLNFLYRDTGRQVVVYDDSASLRSPVTEIFREVYQVNGLNTEGINANPTVSKFVKVFDSNGGPVGVARTG